MGSISFTRLFGTETLPEFSQALCGDLDLDPDMWYSDEISSERIAQRICGKCPLGPNDTDSCHAKALQMEAALRDRPYGVWGGRTAAQRISEAGRGYGNDLSAVENVLSLCPVAFSED